MNDACLLDRLRLARAPGIGPRTARLLEDRLGPPETFLRLPFDVLRERGVPARVARVLVAAAAAQEPACELARIRREGWQLVALGQGGYPLRLATIHDPPQVLMARGAFPLGPAGTAPAQRSADAADDRDDRAVAIVGARRATYEGQAIAHRLGAELAAAGVTVVSGLARGIDAAAHRGALEAGGRTLAVLGSGLARIHPPGNLGLAARIAAAGGALLSEFAPDEGPRRHTFPQRNRIVSGLAEGVVVVEAGPRSGALITADFALQEGRELFAVPGSLANPLAQGSNGLLKDGAHLVESAADVLEVLYGVRSAEPRAPGVPEEPARAARAPASGSAAERHGGSAAERHGGPAPGAPGSDAVGRSDPHDPRDGDLRDEAPADAGPRERLLAALGARCGREVPALAEATGLDVGAVMRALGLLELEGLARRAPDGYRREPGR